jgi:hypothetical protein
MLFCQYLKKLGIRRTRWQCRVILKDSVKTPGCHHIHEPDRFTLKIGESMGDTLRRAHEVSGLKVEQIVSYLHLESATHDQDRVILIVVSVKRWALQIAHRALNKVKSTIRFGASRAQHPGIWVSAFKTLCLRMLR